MHESVAPDSTGVLVQSDLQQIQMFQFVYVSILHTYKSQADHRIPSATMVVGQ